MKKFVVCFLLNKDYTKTLMILKKKKIYTGLYNGLGGKIEEGETAKAAAIREIIEESLNKIVLTNPKHLATINFPTSKEVPMNNGVKLYVFYDVIDDKIELSKEEEAGGKIEWKPIEFALDINNPQLGGDHDIPYYIHMALTNEKILNNKNLENRNDKGLWFKDSHQK